LAKANQEVPGVAEGKKGVRRLDDFGMWKKTPGEFVLFGFDLHDIP
jgi:hypothetical protein